MRAFLLQFDLINFLAFVLVICIFAHIQMEGTLAANTVSDDPSTLSPPSGGHFENKTLYTNDSNSSSGPPLSGGLTPAALTQTSATTRTSTTTTTGFVEVAAAQPASTSNTVEGEAIEVAAVSPAPTTVVNNKTSSKFSLDFVLSKNHWTKASEMPEKQKNSQTQTFRNKHHHEHHWGPFFEEPLNANEGDQSQASAHLFTEAVLNCRVGMLRDKTVMWVRRTTEKVSLLTVGNVTYSGDPRIRVKFQYPNNWRLLINPAQKDDAGLYMCQVSTHPPRVFATNLTILEPPLRLIDEQEHEVSDRYYKSGSTIDLKCQISRSFLIKEKSNILRNQTKSPTNANDFNQTDVQQIKFEKDFKEHIVWSKDDESLPTTAVNRFSITEKWLNSRITIPDAKLPDGGNYSCTIGKLFKSIVQVQVLTGELPAAVQHNSAAALPTKLSHSLTIITVFIIYILSIYVQQTPHIHHPNRTTCIHSKSCQGSANISPLTCNYYQIMS